MSLRCLQFMCFRICFHSIEHPFYKVYYVLCVTTKIRNPSLCYICKRKQENNLFISLDFKLNLKNNFWTVYSLFQLNPTPLLQGIFCHHKYNHSVRIFPWLECPLKNGSKFHEFSLTVHLPFALPSQNYAVFLYFSLFFALTHCLAVHRGVGNLPDSCSGKWKTKLKLQLPLGTAGNSH